MGLSPSLGGGGRGRPTLLGPLEGANLNHSTRSDPVYENTTGHYNNII
jgi:hypothetical protein